jgi:hypothetical protein
MLRSSALASALWLIASGAQAQGTINTAVPFSGDFSEGFESFPNYQFGPNLIDPVPEPASIMGGQATMTSTGSALSNGLLVYEPGVAPVFLNSSGQAQVAEGSKGAGVSATFPVGNVTFGQPRASIRRSLGRRHGRGSDRSEHGDGAIF